MTYDTVIPAKAGIAAGPHAKPSQAKPSQAKPSQAKPRGLRHSFGLHAIRSGVPLNLVQRWLGHASMHTTAIYLQAIGDEEREIAARMWAS
jgi:site-specific recombinase XerD